MGCASDFSPSLLAVLVTYVTTGVSLVGVPLALFLSNSGSQARQRNTPNIRERLRKARLYIIAVFIVPYVIILSSFGCYQVLGGDTSVKLEQPGSASILTVTSSMLVKGSVACSDPRDYVFVVSKPLSSSAWRVEDAPSVNVDGSFEANVIFNAADSYHINAIITERPLGVGDEMSRLPPRVVRSNTLSAVRPLAIVFPARDTQVLMDQKIRGTFVPNAVRGQHIWVFIVSREPSGIPRFSAQQPWYINEVERSWEAVARIGEEADHGKSFQVIAMLASEEAHQWILDQIDKESRITQKPPGAATYDSILVTRE